MSAVLDLEPDSERMAEAAELRRRVFVLEQGVDPAIERDGRDGEAHHVVVYVQGIVRATGRLMLFERVAKAQRVAVEASHRGEGLGRLVMEGLETRAAQLGAHTLKLSSQDEAVPFYERLGYVGQGDPYLEAGIVHLAMSKALRPRG